MSIWPETQTILPTNEIVILTNFHKNRAKIVDFLLVIYFGVWVIFFVAVSKFPSLCVFCVQEAHLLISGINYGFSLVFMSQSFNWMAIMAQKHTEYQFTKNKNECTQILGFQSDRFEFAYLCGRHYKHARHMPYAKRRILKSFGNL